MIRILRRAMRVCGHTARNFRVRFRRSAALVHRIGPTLAALCLFPSTVAIAQDLEAVDVALVDEPSLHNGVDITESLSEGAMFYLFATFEYRDLTQLQSWTLTWYWDGFLIHEAVVDNAAAVQEFQRDGTVSIVVSAPAFTAAPGDQQLSFRVDATNSVAEVDEANNEVSRDFRVAAVPVADRLYVYDDPRNFDRSSDGNTKADYAVYHVALPQWFILLNSNEIYDPPFGRRDTQQVIGDFDGDGDSDAGAYDPQSGRWYLLCSTEGFRVRHLGFEDTVAVPGHYNGDGITDLAVYDPPTGNWHIQLSGGGGNLLRQWGWSETHPVPRDYDGDNITDIAVYHPDTGTWYIRQSSTATLRQQNWGYAATHPVPEDYDGDGMDDIAVYHKASGDWYILQSSTSTLRQQNWGFDEALAVPADYDGDGSADIAVYWPETGGWYVLGSVPGFFAAFQFGYFETLPAGFVPR